MKDSSKSVIVLFSICLVVAALLAAVNYITAPLIEQADIEKTNNALKIVMKDATAFDLLDTEGLDLPGSVTDVYKGDNGGYVFKMSVSGYASGLVILCGIGTDGTVTGVQCLSSGETLGAEKTYGDSFTGKTSIDGIDTVSGATLTTKAFRNAINDAFTAFNAVKGGN